MSVSGGRNGRTQGPSILGRFDKERSSFLVQCLQTKVISRQDCNGMVDFRVCRPLVYDTLLHVGQRVPVAQVTMLASPLV